MKDSAAGTSSNRQVAVYKGLKVAVYTVAKTELSLNRNDLIELIKVCASSADFIFGYTKRITVYLCIFVTKEAMLITCAHAASRYCASILKLKMIIS